MMSRNRLAAFRGTYSGLEAEDLFIGKGVRLGNDRNQINLGMKSSHNLNVEGLQGVTCRLDEEHTSVNAVVNDVHAVDLVLRVQVGIETLLDVVDDGSP